MSSQNTNPHGTPATFAPSTLRSNSNLIKKIFKHDTPPDISIARPLSATEIYQIPKNDSSTVTANNKRFEIRDKLTEIRPTALNKMNPLRAHNKIEKFIGPIPKYQQQTRSGSLHNLGEDMRLHTEMLRKLNIQHLEDQDDSLPDSLIKLNSEKNKEQDDTNELFGVIDDKKPTFPFNKKHIKIEERISLLHLRNIELKFDQFNDSIDLENFTQIVLTVLDLERSKYEKHVRNLFMKIDTQCKETIDWNQFLSFIAVELQEKERVQLERNRVRFNLPAAKPGNVKGNLGSGGKKNGEPKSILQYRDICDIISIRELRDGGFATANTDGTVLVFPRIRAGISGKNVIPEPRRKLVVKKNTGSGSSSGSSSNDKSGDSTGSSQNKWITDMAIMKSKVAIATGDRELLIYELFSGELYVTLDGLRRLPVRLEISWIDDRLIIVIGDDLGCISLIDIENSNEVLNIWSNKVEVKKGETKSDGSSVQKPKEIKGVMSLDELIRKFPNDVKHHRVHLHDDWITQIQIVPETKEVYTSSNSPSASLVKFSFHSNSYSLNDSSFNASRKERSQSLANKSLLLESNKTSGFLTFSVHKGVKSFSYCKEKLVIVTGGLDRILRLWNPYVPKSPTATLVHHNAPIEMVEIDANQNIFISIDLQKNVKIWNLGDQTLLTDVYSKSHMISKADISRANYLFNSQSLIICTDNIFALGMKPKQDLSSSDKQNQGGEKKTKAHISMRLQQGTNEAYTHRDPITTIVYNKSFDQIITCSATAVCRIWNASTGELIFEFGGVETSNDGTEQSKNGSSNGSKLGQGHNGCEITSATLDDTGRRLITTGRDGNTCIWNPNSGECLTTLSVTPNSNSRKKKEVHDCVCVTINQRNKFICTVGWDRRIRLYSDLRRDGGYKQHQLPEQSWIDDIQRGHKEDIVGVTYCPPHLLATIDYQGNLFIWNLVSGHISRKIKYTPKIDTNAGEQPDNSEKGSRQIIHSIVGFPKRHAENESAVSEQFTRPTTRTPLGNLESTSSLVKSDPISAIAIGTCDGYLSMFSIFDSEPYTSVQVTKREAKSIAPAITSLKTSLDETMLLCGDSDGYVTILDVRNFGLSKNDQIKPKIIRRWRAHIHSINNMEILLLNQRRTGKDPREEAANLHNPSNNYMKSSSMGRKANQDTYEDAYQLVTISDDRRARVWTFSGDFIGTFGQEKPWDNLLQSTWQHPMTPEDVLFNPESLPKGMAGVQDKYKDVTDDLEKERQASKPHITTKEKSKLATPTTPTIKSRKTATNSEIKTMLNNISSNLPRSLNNSGKHLRAIKMSKHREKVLNNPAPNDPAYVSMTSNAIFRKVLVFDLQDTPGEPNNNYEDFKSIIQQQSSHKEIKLDDRTDNTYDNLDNDPGAEGDQADPSLINEQFENLSQMKIVDRFTAESKSRTVKFQV